MVGNLDFGRPRGPQVTEFRYGHEVSGTFRSGQLASLRRTGAGWLRSDDAVVFIDNHDTQRGHGAGEPLTFTDGDLYEIANAFMLAWPYGHAKVMSSYAFQGSDDGPPASTACEEGWICEHRWPAIANMIAFRNALEGATQVDEWWDDGDDQIAFSIGGRGFLAINRRELHRSTRVFHTGLAAGTYCDALTGRIERGQCTGRQVQVQADGTAALSIGPVDAVALHAHGRIWGQGPAVSWTGAAPGLGGHFDADESHVRFNVFSERASAIDVCLYDRPQGQTAALCAPLRRGPKTKAGIWSVTLETASVRAAGVTGALYYGYRAWGPNWPKSGYLTDVDRRGNRFNPNKLLVDPYAREVSHDPGDLRAHATGPDFRDIDNGETAPKALVLPSADAARTVARVAGRPFRDSVIYEVHVRGFTMNDPSVPPAQRGTYAGAATKAAYLRDLGITAIELMPVHETTNDQNDSTPDASGDNYWGYASTSFFAPDRRYASDQSPGGPTRELKDMVEAFHAEGIEVFVDVVFNHTAETGTWDRAGQVATLLSWRGLDNASYYELARRDGARYANHNGVGPNVDVTHPRTREMLIDALRYWADDLGVDGFRFDLAAVLGNTCAAGCFSFSDSQSALPALRAALPDVDLIAEPWGIGPGTYRIGEIGSGWAEWNGAFRDTIRRDQNELGRTETTPRALMNVLAGSGMLFADDGRKPWHSINYIASHDGFALRDVYACNVKQNEQPWPFGPSSGGDDANHSWDYGGDVGRQRQAARTGLALVMLSSGVPMINGGDELYRTQYCNNNPYNLDSDRNWIDWAAGDLQFAEFTRRLIALRHAVPQLRRAEFGSPMSFYSDRGQLVWDGYLDNPANHFLGFTAGDAAYVAYNGWNNAVDATLPPGQWTLVGDTSAHFEARGNMLDAASQIDIPGGIYTVAPRSVAVFVRR